MDFSIAAYVASHGRRPRGDGSWGFCPAAAWRSDNYLDAVVWFRGTYSIAKQQAAAHFRAIGQLDIVVCP